MLITRFIVETRTPLHCGASDESLTLDQPVSRDPFGFWNMQGSSVAGLLRAGLNSVDSEAADTLFGSMKDNSASLIWCSDAFVLDYDGKRACDKAVKGKSTEIPTGPFIRDHVKIDLKRGAAEHTGKFDEEIVPPGVRFAFTLTFDEWEKDEAQIEKCKEYFIKLCTLIKNGEIAFGGKSVSGYGFMNTVYAQCRHFDMKNEKDVNSWLNLSDTPRFENNEGTEINLDNALEIIEKGLSFKLSVPFETEGPMLVGGVNTQDTEADMVCLITTCLNYEAKSNHNQDYYTIPGSSLRGILRHRVYDVANASGLDGEKFLNNLFGHIKGNDDTDQTKMGKISCEDCYLKGYAPSNAQKIQHVSIDSFTGGAVKSALFDEQPLCEKFEFELNLRGQNLTASEGKMLLHALLDMCTGQLAVGGGVNRGNGRVKLKGLKDESYLKKTLLDELVRHHSSISFNGEKIDLNDAAAFDRLLKELDGAE